MKKLGLCIKELRIKSGFSQSELATQIGITQGYFSKIEKGQKIPTFENLQNIAQAFSIPLSILLYMAESDSIKRKGKFYELMDKNLKILSKYIITSKQRNNNQTDLFMEKANKLEEEFDSILADLEKLDFSNKETILS